MTGKRLFLTVCLAFVSLGNGIAASADEAVLAVEEIDAFVNKAMEEFKVPGAAVGVIVDGKVVFSKGYGMRDQAQGLPVTENTLFAICSCTKAFTTFLLGQLVDEGLINWDDPVIKYIPEFRLKDQHATHRITIRDLVTHRSGLPGHEALWYNNSNISRAEIVSRLQYLEPSYDLREKFQYNNLMYTVAGLVVEKVTGQTWEEAMQARVFKPIGMSHSNTSVEESQKTTDFSLPYIEKEGAALAVPLRSIGNVGPAGSINSSLSDMLKWMEVHLSEGKEVIKKESLKEMHTLQMAVTGIPEFRGVTFGYGLGWLIGTYEGKYLVQHDGHFVGFYASTSLFPKEKTGVVILTNSNSGGPFLVSAVANAIMGSLFSEEKVDWIAKMVEIREQFKGLKENKEEGAQAVGTPSHPYESYAGTYEHPGYGLLEVTVENGEMVAFFNRIACPLRHKCYDIFTGTPLDTLTEDMKLNFSFFGGATGEISELHVPLELTVQPIVFKKKPQNSLLAADYLKQFEGTFELGEISIEIQLRGKQLSAVLPGQPIYELVPEKPYSFLLKGFEGFSFRFVPNEEGKIGELQTVQPNGIYTFKAKY